MVKLPRHDSIPILYIIRAFRIILSNDSIISRSSLATDREILSACGRIFSSPWMGQAFIYLCRTGAVTAWLLQIQLGMPETTSHRVLKQLMALEIVEPVIKMPRRRMKRSGPIPKVWGLRGHYTPEDVAKAINLHYRTLSPKYRLAREVAQSMLTEYLEPRHLKEVSYREIVAYVRGNRRVSFNAPDIAELAADYIHEKGIKVWR
jgi:hypothetical protein